MDLEALIRVAKALDAGVQEVLAPAMKENPHIQGTLELLYQAALDLDREITRLILLWIGLEIPPEEKEEKDVPHEREPQPPLQTLQAISPIIPVNISLAALLERESTIREVLRLQQITGVARLPLIPVPDRGVLPFTGPRFITPPGAPSGPPPVSVSPAPPAALPQILSASLLLHNLYHGLEGGERGGWEEGAPGYSWPLTPVPPIREAAGLQGRIIQSIPEEVTGLSRSITERVSLQYPEMGEEFPELGVPPYPPTDLRSVARMIDVPQRIIQKMVRPGDVRAPEPPDHPEMVAAPRQVAEALSLQRHFIQTVTERTMGLPRAVSPEAFSPQFISPVPGLPTESSPAAPWLQGLQRDILQSSPVAAQIALIHQITSLMQESAGTFPEEARIIPPLTPLPPHPERGTGEPIPSLPVPPPGISALRPIIEIPHFAPLLRQPVPEAPTAGGPPPFWKVPSIEPYTGPVSHAPAAPGLMHALGGLAASRQMVSGFIDQLSPFISPYGGAGVPLAGPGAFLAPPEGGAWAGVPLAALGAIQAPSGGGAVAGLQPSWPGMDWILPAALAGTVASSLPFGGISMPGGSEAQTPFPVSWPMAREILPGLPFERMVSLMPAGAGTMKALSSVLEPLALTIPQMGGGGPGIPSSLLAPVSPLGQNISLAFGGGSPPPPAKNEISIANTFQIEVSVKGHDTERELRELGQKIGTILSDELKRYGGTLWR